MCKTKLSENSGTSLYFTGEPALPLDQNSALSLKRGTDAPRAMAQQEPTDRNYKPKELEELANGVSKARALAEEAERDAALTIMLFMFLQLVRNKLGIKHSKNNL